MGVVLHLQGVVAVLPGVECGVVEGRGVADREGGLIVSNYNHSVSPEGRREGLVGGDGLGGELQQLLRGVVQADRLQHDVADVPGRGARI